MTALPDDVDPAVPRMGWRCGVIRTPGAAAGPALVVLKFGGSLLARPDWPTLLATLVQTQTAKKLAAVQIGLGPGVTRDHPDYAALTLLTRVLSSFPTGWLDQALRGEDVGLVYVVGSYQVTGLVPGYVGVTFNAKPESVTEALQKTAAVFERARTEKVDDATLARAKASVLTDEFVGKQSNEDRAAEASLQVMYGLGLDESEKFLAKVQALTAEDLQKTAQKYLRNPVIAVISHEPLPKEQLLKAFPEAAPTPEK